jgi:site-specific DNA-methyltransferase (adenine-specific)
MSGRYIVGDSLTVLRSLPDASVDLVLTSPPFLALRSYLPADDPSKHLEVGAERTPGDYIDALLDVVEECRRVLAPHGSIAFELGDTYSGSGGAGGDYADGGLREGQQKFSGTAAKAARLNGETRPRPPRARSPRPKYDGDHLRDRDANEEQGIIPVRSHSRRERDGWPLNKSLCLVPELLRFALVYGFNPLTGRETPRWRARNVVRWCRPNPPVGSLGDKVRPATSDMVIACVGGRRYFDLDAVRQPHQDPSAALRPHPKSSHRSSYPGGCGDIDGADDERDYAGHRGNVHGAPPLDHWWVDDSFDQDAWLISTAPYKGSHYATWPEELLHKPILAMAPQRVCTTCGCASERITETAPWPDDDAVRDPERLADVGGDRHGLRARAAITIGWTDCGHGTWRRGVVLDPFAGSGTTLAVAIGHGREAIGVDLDARNADLARERVGMFLEVEHFDGSMRCEDCGADVENEPHRSSCFEADEPVDVPVGEFL